MPIHSVYDGLCMFAQHEAISKWGNSFHAFYTGEPALSKLTYGRLAGVEGLFISQMDGQTLSPVLS